MDPQVRLTLVTLPALSVAAARIVTAAARSGSLIRSDAVVIRLRPPMRSVTSLIPLGSVARMRIRTVPPGRGLPFTTMRTAGPVRSACDRAGPGDGAGCGVAVAGAGVTSAVVTTVGDGVAVGVGVGVGVAVADGVGVPVGVTVGVAVGLTVGVGVTVGVTVGVAVAVGVTVGVAVGVTVAVGVGVGASGGPSGVFVGFGIGVAEAARRRR